MSLSSRNIRHLMSSICFAVSRRLASASRESNADEPPAVAQGSKGVVVPGCPMCRKRFGTMKQTLRVTPAMETGIADQVWSIEELVQLLVKNANIAA